MVMRARWEEIYRVAARLHTGGGLQLSGTPGALICRRLAGIALIGCI